MNNKPSLFSWIFSSSLAYILLYYTIKIRIIAELIVSLKNPFYAMQIGLSVSIQIDWT